jgi:c-di-GMP-binding flagellar brake protein YcgR
MVLVEMGRIKRMQRRRYVRLNKVINLSYQFVTRPVKKPIPIDGGEKHTSRSINLSAAGVLLLLDDDTRVQMDDFLLLSFEPNNLKHLPEHIMAVVRHVTVNEQQVRMAGVEFIIKEDLPRHFKVDQFKLLPAEVKVFDDRQLNQLVSELFTEEVNMRQKGLL